MKKITILATLLLLISSTPAFAQTTSTARGSKNASNTVCCPFAWGMAIGGVAVVAVVAGVVAASAAGSPSSFNH